MRRCGDGPTIERAFSPLRPLIGIIAVTLALTVEAEEGAAQALTGTTGLVTIPTADMPDDGVVAFGSGFLNKVDLPEEIFDAIFPDGLGRFHGLAYYVTLGYLPFLEVSLRLTRFVDVSEPQALGDRMVSVRLRVFQESHWVPAVVVGAHDLVGTRVFNALYGVASKHFQLPASTGTLGVHAGYASDAIAAAHHQFSGPFAGVSYGPAEFVKILVEHDGADVSAGVRLTLVERISALVALQHLEGFSAGISYRLFLTRR